MDISIVSTISYLKKYMAHLKILLKIADRASYLDLSIHDKPYNHNKALI